MAFHLIRFFVDPATVYTQIFITTMKRLILTGCKVEMAIFLDNMKITARGCFRPDDGIL